MLKVNWCILTRTNSFSSFMKRLLRGRITCYGCTGFRAMNPVLCNVNRPGGIHWHMLYTHGEHVYRPVCSRGPRLKLKSRDVLHIDNLPANATRYANHQVQFMPSSRSCIWTAARRLRAIQPVTEEVWQMNGVIFVIYFVLRGHRFFSRPCDCRRSSLRLHEPFVLLA